MGKKTQIVTKVSDPFSKDYQIITQLFSRLIKYEKNNLAMPVTIFFSKSFLKVGKNFTLIYDWIWIYVFHILLKIKKFKIFQKKILSTTFWNTTIQEVWLQFLSSLSSTKFGLFTIIYFLLRHLGNWTF